MTKAYEGRLAFDPDLNCHVDEEGTPLVTEDGGKTWRYAKVNEDGSLHENEQAHFDRHHERFVSVDGTANRLLELQLEHGREKAEKLMAEESPHHFEVQPDDPHVDGLKFHPDHKAAKLTSHTEAGK